MQLATADLAELKSDLQYLYDRGSEILIEDPETGIKREYQATIALNFIDDSKDTIMCARDFIVNFGEIYNNQFVDYPCNLIKCLVFAEKGREQFRVIIDNYVDDEVILYKVPATKIDLRTLDLSMQLQSAKTAKRRLSCDDASMGLCICGLLTLVSGMVLLLDELTKIRVSDVVRSVFNVAMIISVMASICLCAGLCYNRHLRKEVNANRRLLQITGRDCGKLAEMVLHIISSRTVMKAFEQKTMLHGVLSNYLLSDIADAVILHTIGYAQLSANQFLELEHQTALVDYFKSRKRYVALEIEQGQPSPHQYYDVNSANAKLLS